MTKTLTNQEKADNAKKRKDARKQQKPPSTTVKTITTPKHEPPAGDTNLCDACAYEVGQCDGKPKFAIDQDPTLTGAAADRVTTCEGYLAVETMPTVEETREGAAGPGAGPGEKPTEERRECDVVHLRDYPGCFEDCPKDECDGVPADAVHDDDDKVPPEANEEESEEPEEPKEPTFIPAPGDARPDPKRFNKEEDLGTCQSCQKPLKRTAFNRYQDAVRCTNPRCRAYRAIVRQLSTGVK